MPGYGGMDIMFTITPIIISVGFIVVFGTIIVMAIRGLGEWSRNNEAPVLTVDAAVVAKRTNVSGGGSHHHGDGAVTHTSASTTYYATFEVESGDRIELRLPDGESGLLAEGDRGKLTFQGTRYKGFERNRNY